MARDMEKQLKKRSSELKNIFHLRNYIVWMIFLILHIQCMYKKFHDLSINNSKIMVFVTVEITHT